MLFYFILWLFFFDPKRFPLLLSLQCRPYLLTRCLRPWPPVPLLPRPPPPIAFQIHSLPLHRLPLPQGHHHRKSHRRHRRVFHLHLSGGNLPARPKTAWPARRTRQHRASRAGYSAPGRRGVKSRGHHFHRINRLSHLLRHPHWLGLSAFVPSCNDCLAHPVCPEVYFHGHVFALVCGDVVYVSFRHVCVHV